MPTIEVTIIMADGAVLPLNVKTSFDPDQQARDAMNAIRSTGHTECNRYCRPPLKHSSGRRPVPVGSDTEEDLSA